MKQLITILFLFPISCFSQVDFSKAEIYEFRKMYFDTAYIVDCGIEELVHTANVKEYEDCCAGELTEIKVYYQVRKNTKLIQYGSYATNEKEFELFFPFNGLYWVEMESSICKSISMIVANCEDSKEKKISRKCIN